MIHSLKISNFQSHEKTSLDFSSGVNIIVGSSDSGKTAIIRAIRWLSRNRPSGDSIRSSWGGDTQVLLETEAAIVRRFKGKEDRYELKLQGGRDTVFKAFHTNVPQEITALLNLNEINLQHQFDSSFLISNTPGEVAQHFNKVARLDKIDTGLQNVQRAIRELEQTTKFKTVELQKHEEQLKEFDHLEKFEAEVEVLEELDKQYTNAIQREVKLKKLIDQVKETEREILEYTPLLSLEGQVTELLSLIEKRDTLEEQKVDLLVDIRDILDHEEELEEKTAVLSLQPDVDSLLLLYTNVKTLNTQRLSVFKLLSQVNSITTTLNNNNALQVRLQAQFDKEMGPVCKLCGQTIKRK